MEEELHLSDLVDGALAEGTALTFPETGTIIVLAEFDPSTGTLSRANLTREELGGNVKVVIDSGIETALDDAFGRTMPSA